MIGELGYSVIAADSPEQALRILGEQPVTLVFTDVVMPGPITSREFADRARELQLGVKVLFTSGYTQNAVVHGGRLDDGVELISKPYRRDQLALTKDRTQRKFRTEACQPVSGRSPPPPDDTDPAEAHEHVGIILSASDFPASLVFSMRCFKLHCLILKLVRALTNLLL